MRSVKTQKERTKSFLFFVIKHDASFGVVNKKSKTMIDEKDTSPADKDGKYEFQLYYAEREITCRVEKEQNKLYVHADNIEAELEIQEDGSVIQTKGNELPDSSIDFIKKHILG